ncbi:zinc finger protein 518A [Halichoeres trimaculatus]|uniref:zinc finger protein 518A n=1 Tax=Halichoeres trimaculatus TaxID=147232 RepID=UPI003D9E63AB
MEEELGLPQDSARCNLSAAEDEKEKVVDFVYKHFRGMTDGSLFSSVEQSPLKDHGVSTRRDRPSPNKGHCKIQQGAVFSGKILSFECSVCKDGFTYSPNDLLKHFQAAHKGTLPTYPCDLCGFFTNEFPALQRHRIQHRNTLVTCELCNDDVQYSLLLLTRHYIMCHSLNGQFHCDWCQFTTMDAGTFVQHIHHHNESHWKCTKCRHISLSEEDHQKHMKAHSGTFPFTCQICGFGSARSEYLKKHTSAVHKEEADRRNSWKSIEDTISPANSSACFKLLLKKSESQENYRVSKLNCLSGTVSNQNGHVIKPELSLEETHHFVDVAQKDKTWCRGLHKTEQSDCEGSAGSETATHSSPNGLTVLMVKNKISLPPNCTTKVMGFKMVEGKKHLVLKVIPTSKQDLPTQSGPSAPNPVSDKSKLDVDNGEGSHCKSSNPCCFSVSPKNRLCAQMHQDEIMTVKVKIEEEETSVCSLDYTPHRDIVRGLPEPSLSSLSTRADWFYPTANEFDHSHLSQTACSEKSLSDCSSGPGTVCSSSGTCSGEVTGLSTPLKVSQKNVSKQPVEDCGAADKSSLFTAADQHRFKSSNTSEKEDQSCQSPPENDCPDFCRTDIQHKNDQKKLSADLLPQLESAPLSSSQGRESVLSSQNCTKHSSPNQEVFSFHNYSKELFSSYSTRIFDPSSEPPSDKHCVSELTQFSLNLAESPELTQSTRGDCSLEKNQEIVKRVADSDSEANACIADDISSGDENPESVLQDFNIIKIEDEIVPISKTQPDTKSSSNSSGLFVENHSDATMTQQPKKGGVVSSNTALDSLKQTRTTLRILQLPERKQPVFLKTTENRYALPVQVKTSPGFKLITNSTNPRINISFMTPGSERSLNPASPTLCTNSGRSSPLPKATTSEKGSALFSAVQPGFNNTSSPYFLNTPGFKGPVLLSSTPHNTSTETANKTQPTCYLVQRSVQFGQTPSTTGLRLASAQIPLNSQPVLAMPMNSSVKPSHLQASRQAFLLRYISPPKSNLCLNNQEGKTGAAHVQTNKSAGNKVIFKIVTPTGSLLTSGAPTSSSQPLFLATRPQSQCFLVSSNKANGNAPTTIKKLIALQNSSQREFKESCVSSAQVNNEVPQCDLEKPILSPRPIRPPSQRTKRRKALFDELPETVHKARRLAHKAVNDRESSVLWRPLSKDFERTLRLVPLSSLQQVKCPRRYQPVVVLNHPDAEIPEVTRIMKVVHRHRGAVTKVSLSQKTVQALSELSPPDRTTPIKPCSSHSGDQTARPVQSSVRERFLLKMKLRKKSRRKYEVVDPSSGCCQEAMVFTCWFCGRLFNSQEDWIGHGQRHLMEATRDWNKLF